MKRRKAGGRWLMAASMLLLATASVWAGGPMRVGGPSYGRDAEPFVWDRAKMPIQYTVDAGPLSATVSNSSGLDRVAKAFGVWQGAATATISFNYAGPIVTSGGQPAGDITTVAQYNDTVATCKSGAQNSIVFDADGSLMKSLGLDADVIGFAGPCSYNTSTGYIDSAHAVLNGAWQDGNTSNGELTTTDFNAAITHEFGHFIGLDHSQINVQILDTHNCTADIVAGLPVMFPFSICHRPTDGNGFPVLTTDDAAWVSKLYPNGQTAAQYGAISGVIYFSDGVSAAQGVNVIARAVDDPNTPQNESLRVAVSAVSGYLFTGNPGQKVSGDNDSGDPDGSRQAKYIGYYEIPVPAGTYTVEIESVNAQFSGGSSVGPLSPPVPLFSPAVPEFWNKNESAYDIPLERDPITVAPGQKVENINIIENGTPPRFDRYEDDGMAALVTASPVPTTEQTRGSFASPGGRR